MNIFRKLILTSLCTFLFSCNVWALSPCVTFNGEKLDVTAEIVNDRVIVPLRGVFEAMGFVVDWEAETKSAVLKDDVRELRITLGSRDALVTKGNIQFVDSMDAAPVVINGHIYVPLRFVAEHSDYIVKWKGKVKIVDINNTDVDVKLLKQRGAEHYGFEAEEVAYQSVQAYFDTEPYYLVLTYPKTSYGIGRGVIFEYRPKTDGPLGH